MLCRTSQAGETVRRDIPLSTRPLSGVTLPIEGHLKLSKQVELVRVGGHSPGQMAVFVGTAKGRVCIASDFLYNYTNLRHDWPIGPVWNMDERISGLRFISLGLRSADYTDYADFGVRLRHITSDKHTFLARFRLPRPRAQSEPHKLSAPA